MEKILSILMLSLILIFSVFGFEAYVGKETYRKLIIKNPSVSLKDLLNVEIRTEGNINAYFTDSMENRKKVEINPGEEKAIPITVIGSICTENSCEGKLVVSAVSEKTGNRVEKKFDFMVYPEKGGRVVGSAPDLNFLNLVVILIAGAIIIYWRGLK